MGLFRKKSSIDNSAWINPAHKAKPGNEATKQQRQISRDKLEFSNSLTSQETMTYNHIMSSDEGSMSSTPEHVAALERKLHARDETISRMRKAMRAEEKVQSKRIDLLERELEQLVELSSGECALQGKIKSQTESKKSISEDAKFEITALQELLTRVIAEKDRLGFENDNLKTLLKESSPCCDNKKNKMPSSITELDSMMREQDRKKQRQEAATPPTHSNSEQDRQAKKSHDAKQEKSKNSSKARPDKKEETEHTMLYQMSCRNCPQDPKYTGVFTSTKTNRQNELKRKLETHFCEVWNMIQDDDNVPVESRSVDSISNLSKEEEDWYDNTSSSSFPTSSLALHLVRHHCREFKSEKEVMQWCMINIKVEIQTKGTRPDHSDKKKKKKSKSKSGGKIKKKQDANGKEHIKMKEKKVEP